MPLPPAETTPVLVLKWTEKALKVEGLVQMVEKELERGKIILISKNRKNRDGGKGSREVLLLTASQESLEEEAEETLLVKERDLPMGEIIMDRFRVRDRPQFSTKRRMKNPDESKQAGVDEEGLFTAHERCILVEEILEDINVQDPILADMLRENGNKDKERTSLRYLLQSHGWVDVMTPLHVDEIKEKILRQTMWQWSVPLKAIHGYYGPSIAYYFAFLQFLRQWLVVLAVPGVTVFLFRVWRHDTIDTDEYTPFYGLFCFVWAVLLCRFWTRQEKWLAYDWGEMNEGVAPPGSLSSYTVQAKGAIYTRPEFTGRMRTSPVTGKPELFYPHYLRKGQYMVSGIITALMLAVAFFVMILSLNLQGYIQPDDNQFHPFHYARLAALAEEGAVFDAKSSWRCFIPVVIHVVSILTLNNLYRRVARVLTDWENHVTRDAHENSLILKRFLFEAFDCYIVLFYLAFYERDVYRLRSELIAVFNIDTSRRLATEIIIPSLLRLMTKEKEGHPQDLHLETYESFDDYMEMLISFGYVTLFASAYPLASVLFCGAVFIEIRSDCYKLTRVCQKPIDERVASIGMWAELLQAMVWFSCLTNCLLFGFTSDQMMHYIPTLYMHDETGDTHLVNDKGWIAIFVIFGIEHVLVITGLILNALIPATPTALATKLRRRMYLLSTASQEQDASKKID